ncbi:MAG: hypothetical protein ACTSQE_15095 [Candidatus Heimdallarchaeaceae archaeon]
MTESKEVERVEPTLYYQMVLGTVSKDNTLLILPSNFNKTGLVSYLSTYFLEKYSDKKIAIVISNKSSINCYSELLKTTEQQNIASFVSGEIKLEERKKLYQSSSILVVTAHILHNDMLRQAISPFDFSLVVFDNAKLAKGSHAYSKLSEIFRTTRTTYRFVGISTPSFQRVDDLIDVCKTLLITKIDYKSKDDPFIQFCLSSYLNRKIVVPLNRELNDFIVFLNSHIRRYIDYLDQRGITNPHTLRSNFRFFINEVKDKFDDSDIQQHLIALGKNLATLQSLKDTVESSSIDAGLELLTELENKKTYNHSLVNTGLYAQLVDRLQDLRESTLHPKLKRLLQLLKDLTSNFNLCKFLVITNNKITAKKIADFLSSNDFSCFTLVSNSQKQLREKLTDFRANKFSVLITTKTVPVETDSTIFYSFPQKFSKYVNSNGESDSFFLIAHRSQEERVLHKFLNNERFFEKLLEDKNLHEQLILNQQQIFDLHLLSKIDPRTKALLDLSRKIVQDSVKDSNNISDPSIDEEPINLKTQKNKPSKVKEKVIPQVSSLDRFSQEDIRLVQFLSSCNLEETAVLLSILNEVNDDTISSLTLEQLYPFFPQDRAKKIFDTIRNRFILISGTFSRPYVSDELDN